MCNFYGHKFPTYSNHFFQELCCIRAVGSFFMVRGGGDGGLSKNVAHHGSLTTKNKLKKKKKIQAKHLKAVPQKTKRGPKYK